jgi:hypothetical protein
MCGNGKTKHVVESIGFGIEDTWIWPSVIFETILVGPGMLDLVGRVVASGRVYKVEAGRVGPLRVVHRLKGGLERLPLVVNHIFSCALPLPLNLYLLMIGAS